MLQLLVPFRLVGWLPLCRKTGGCGRDVALEREQGKARPEEIGGAEVLSRCDMANTRRDWAHAEILEIVSTAEAAREGAELKHMPTGGRSERVGPASGSGRIEDTTASLP